MESTINDKVLAMYHAVWELIKEGQNVYQMKVVDITNRAGIGKGTAYEYFRSKEELIGKAMQYQIETEFQELLYKIQMKQSLKDALEVCYEWMEADQERVHCILTMLRKNNTAMEMLPTDISCLRKNWEKGSGFIRDILTMLVRLGKQDKVIAENLPDDLCALQILSQMIGYYMYSNMEVSRTAKVEIQDYFYHFLRYGLERRKDE